MAVGLGDAGVNTEDGPRTDVAQRGVPSRGKKKTECAGTRTRDLRIKSPLLYQLSYALAWANVPTKDFAAVQTGNLPVRGDHLLGKTPS